MENMGTEERRKVILVTDGDRVARKAVEKAAQNIGGRCISRSAGNPTPLPGDNICKLIMKTPYDPVVVMADDRGHTGQGNGENVIWEIDKCPDIDIIGVIAVASNTDGVSGVEVDFSVTKHCTVVNGAVNKCGDKIAGNVVKGDTVDILQVIDVPVIVGVGDPGKMGGRDDCSNGSPILTKAMEEIVKRSSLVQDVEDEDEDEGVVKVLH